MGWFAALVLITALAMMGFLLWRLETEKGWEEQAEGLRERLERDELPRT